jgi:hypothetical protein
MKKSTQAALSFAAGYLILRIGIAIHRHPVGSAVVLTILIIGYAIDGASALEVASATLSLAFIYGLVFIIGLACAGRWIAALCWFMALFFCVGLVQSWIECATNTCYYSEAHWYASKLAANGLYQSSLGEYEWWTNHGRWLLSPAAFCVGLLLLSISVIEDGFLPRRQPAANNKRKAWKHTIRIDDTPIKKSERPPPTYENVRLVAEVLSRISAQLIEKHFHLDADTARKFTDRLVEEELFGNLQPDGWHYALTRQMRLRRSLVKHQMRDKRKAEDRPQASTCESMLVGELGKRIGELEGEVCALKAKITRLHDAGKTVIAQREEWKTRALSAEQNVVDLTAQAASRPEARDGRFDALRRLIAKELHPDFCDGGGLEKTLRAEFFKKLWPEIERLVEGR